jgi:hypothetical protein
MGLMDKLKGAGGGMGMPSQEDMATMQRVTRLNQVGVEHPATIKSMQGTGRSDVGGGQEYSFEVDVQPAGGAPYAATFTQYMHVGSMSSWAYDGAAVMVRVDPQDPSSMMLWGGQQ